MSGRYEVGCAGQFAFGGTSRYDDENEAIAACEFGPLGCEAYDRECKAWLGPSCWEEIEDAKARIAARAER